MKNAQYMEEEAVIRKGIDLLIRELGPLEATRFVNIPREKKVDGVKRHRKWQEQLKKNEFFDAVFNDQQL